MNKKQLELGIDLEKLIRITEKSLKDIDLWIESTKDKENIGGIYKNDSNYNLSITEFGDGSGFKLDLARYFGNTRILHLVRDELEKQLKEFQKEFDDL